MRPVLHSVQILLSYSVVDTESTRGYSDNSLESRG